jgi:hypothetical protein
MDREDVFLKLLAGIMRQLERIADALEGWEDYEEIEEVEP